MHNLTVIENKNARFICGVSGGGHLEFVWHKNGRKIRFEKTPRILDYSADPRTACIGIECTQLSDAGKYQCTFTDKDSGQVLVTSCELIVVPRLKKTKELATKSPPAFVRKLQCELNQTSILIFFCYATKTFRYTISDKIKSFIASIFLIVEVSINSFFFFIHINRNNNNNN